MLGLQIYGKGLEHCKVRCLSDNTTAVAYINYKGGAKNDSCDRLAKEVWEFCEVRDLWVIAAHIPGKGKCTCYHGNPYTIVLPDTWAFISVKNYAYVMRLCY